MDNKKEMERAELHRAIWQIANDLRGSVDGWDFKQYVLGTLFYRYISEKLTNYLNREAQEAGEADFDYAALPDEEAETERENLVEEQGYFILPSELFANVRKSAPTNENLNETLEKVFHNIEASATGTASENDLAGHYRDNTIDAFGDAYEYLMGMYASNAGKSGGEYYTPQEVSELLTRLTVIDKARVNKVYDIFIPSLIQSHIAQKARNRMVQAVSDFLCFFAKHAEVTEALEGVKFYFPPPHHPWERGSNENTNGLLREYFPKGQDITDIPDAYIQEMFDKLNRRPRKCLGYRTPYEVYYSKTLHLT